MISIGKINKLKVLKHVDFGVFLDGEDLGDILLPLRYMPDDCDEGSEVEVFVCYDSEDRLMATTDKPFAQVGEYARLKVVSVEGIGSFLDWGLSKNLFLPFAEQTMKLRVGNAIVVYLYLDKSQRIAASMRLQRNKERFPINYKVGENVELTIAGTTDLGYKAIINGKHWGVLYENEVFVPLKYAQKINGWIKVLRPDGKIDLTLHSETGHRAAEEIGPKILELLEKEKGFIAIHDKTPPEKIYELFGASKKKFKIAVGGLYKQRLITVHDDGIRLVKKI